MKKLLIAFCLCFLWCTFSYAECAVKKPFVRVSFRMPVPKYYSKPSEDVQAACPKANYVPDGCTWYRMSYKYEYKTSKQKECNQVTSVDMKLFYKKGNFYVYIDDKYPEGSCEYNAIKKHEDMHVEIGQTISKKKMKKKLEKCILEFNKNGGDAASAVKQCVEEAFDLDEKTEGKEIKI